MEVIPIHVFEDVLWRAAAGQVVLDLAKIHRPNNAGALSVLQ